jgi:steroid 5-alpha reductase family enzyme
MIQIMLISLLISLIIQIGFFSYAAAKKTDKVTDLSYGLTFILIALFFLVSSSFQLIQVVLFFMVLAWGLRLVSYLLTRILKIKADSRFDEIREDFFKFAGFWLIQAVTVWVIMLPSVLILQSTKSLQPTTLTLVGFGVWLTGLTIETFADKQKFEFKNKKENKGKWIQSGLWKYSRHPNYFGEMLCWWGIYIFALPFLSGWEYITIVSPLFISFMLLFFSGIPPLEKRYNERYKDNKEYQKYKNDTPLIIPFIK